jgi:hypothetical protein
MQDLELNKIKTAFSKMQTRYDVILNNYFPSDGFTESNLTADFVKNLQDEMGGSAATWQAACSTPHHNQNTLVQSNENTKHLDAIVFDVTPNTSLIIEPNKFGQLPNRIVTVLEDIKQIKNKANPNILDKGLNHKILTTQCYGILLADYWYKKKTELPGMWPESLELNQKFIYTDQYSFDSGGKTHRYCLFLTIFRV